ncbi:MAG TPA: 4a-hydroxytetrahydrobiopterin dehydratase [Burkholderiaceae bacterium]|nr:4a-hydroxytetrahydrobiopterin dehydratase [Burkholderiaceae bacterium]
MQTAEQLREARCRPLAAGAMTGAEVAAQLQALSGWSLERGALARTFRFSGYHETIAFVNALAWVAHAEDHHPDLAVGYDRCEVRYTTHSVGGISVNDFICAAKVDALYAQRVAAPGA